MTRIVPRLKQDVGFPLHASLILHRHLVTAALILPLVPVSDRIAQLQIASPERERKSVCVCMSRSHLIRRLESREEVYLRFRSTRSV